MKTSTLDAIDPALVDSPLSMERSVFGASPPNARAWSIVFTKGDSAATLTVIASTRSESLAHRATYGPGWRRLHFWVVTLAVRLDW